MTASLAITHAGTLWWHGAHGLAYGGPGRSWDGAFQRDPTVVPGHRVIAAGTTEVYRVEATGHVVGANQVRWPAPRPIPTGRLTARATDDAVFVVDDHGLWQRTADGETRLPGPAGPRALAVGVDRKALWLVDDLALFRLVLADGELTRICAVPTAFTALCLTSAGLAASNARGVWILAPRTGAAMQVADRGGDDVAYDHVRRRYWVATEAELAWFAPEAGPAWHVVPPPP